MGMCPQTPQKLHMKPANNDLAYNQNQHLPNTKRPTCRHEWRTGYIRLLAGFSEGSMGSCCALTWMNEKTWTDLSKMMCLGAKG